MNPSFCCPGCYGILDIPHYKPAVTDDTVATCRVCKKRWLIRMTEVPKVEAKPVPLGAFIGGVEP